MRTDFKYIYAALAAGLALFCAYSSYAQENDDLEVYSGKTATIDPETKEGTITLETFMEGRLISQATPCDIVLVLDMSQSMDLVYGKDDNGKDITRLQALKNACKSFLQSLQGSGQHRVSIVTFNEYISTQYPITHKDGTLVWPQNAPERNNYMDAKGLKGNETYNTDYRIYFNSNSDERSKMRSLYSRVNSLYSDYFIPINDRPDFDPSKTTLEHILDYFSADDTQGTTACFRGMGEAANLLGKRSGYDNYTAAERQTFVVMFTDGVPGQQDATDPDDTLFSDDVGHRSVCFAYNTITYANSLKSNGTKIFTIGIHPKCNPIPSDNSYFPFRIQHGGSTLDQYIYFNMNLNTQELETRTWDGSNAINCFLHMVSSNFTSEIVGTINYDTEACPSDANYNHNYIDGKGMERWAIKYNGGNPTINDDQKSKVISGKHYHSASNPAELVQEFEKISGDIINYANDRMTAETQLRDYIDGRFFKLPDGATVESIVCYARECIGKTSDGKYNFAEGHIDVPGLSVKVNAGIEGKDDEVVVTGFDYKANWVGPLKDTPDPDNRDDWHGQELIVVIPFVLKPGVDASGTLQTNTEESGIYLPGEEDPYKPYPIPAVTWSMITISRTGLEVGESAIYYVYAAEVGADFDDDPVYIVTLNRDDSSPVAKKTIAHVLAREGHADQEDGFYQYKVVETGWSWAYDSDSTADTQAFSRANRQLDFQFSGNHKESTKTGSPSYKLNHGESFTNTYSIIQQ